MTTIDKDAVEKLLKLCRIHCSEDEENELQSSLNNILQYFQQLQEIDTEGVLPCNQVVEGSCNVFREDEITTTLPREVFLANAPSQVGGMIRTPTVLKSI